MMVLAVIWSTKGRSTVAKGEMMVLAVIWSPKGRSTVAKRTRERRKVVGRSAIESGPDLSYFNNSSDRISVLLISSFKTWILKGPSKILDSVSAQCMMQNMQFMYEGWLSIFSSILKMKTKISSGCVFVLVVYK
jgi:hypothetical protein